MTREEAARLLGLPDDASGDDAAKAWKSLAPQVHPDRGGTDAMFDLLTEAKETLQGKPRAQRGQTQPNGDTPTFGGDWSDPQFAEWATAPAWDDAWEPVDVPIDPATSARSKLLHKMEQRKQARARQKMWNQHPTGPARLVKQHLPAILGVVLAAAAFLMPAIASAWHISLSAAIPHIFLTNLEPDPGQDMALSPWWITTPLLAVLTVVTVVVLSRLPYRNWWLFLLAAFTTSTTIGFYFGFFPALLPAMLVLAWFLFTNRN